MNSSHEGTVYHAVEVYRTADGRMHETPEKALEHVADGCRKILDGHLKARVARGKFSANDTCLIVMALVPDADTAKELTDALLSQFVPRLWLV